jgi:adenine deaminase
LLVPALMTTVRSALRTAYVNLMSNSSGVPGFGVEAAEDDGLGAKFGAIGTGRAANIVVVATAASVLLTVFMHCGHPVVQSHHLVERRMHRKNPSDRGHGDWYPARSPERKIGRRREGAASRVGQARGGGNELPFPCSDR